MRQALAGLAARILMLAVLLGGARVEAHDEWLSGQRVDPKTKELCCSGADTKVVDDLVQSAAGGVSFTDRPGEVIPFIRIQPSPDGHWWRSTWGGQTRCVFGPMSY